MFSNCAALESFWVGFDEKDLPIIRKLDLEDHGKPGCPSRQVLAKHQGAVSKSYPQVKLCHLSIPLSTYFSILRKMVRGGYSYKMNEEQEELLHKLRDFTTIRDNATALKMQ